MHPEGEGIGAFATEVLLHGIIDTLKLIPFLFLTYLLMEFIEHRENGNLVRFLNKAGRAGPALGGVLGAVPQCGFGAAAANFYTGRVITIGTLIAVFLSTSDEMIPILIGGNISPLTVIKIVIYKAAVGIAMGFVVDFAMRLMHRDCRQVNIDELCENDECHCERGILHSAIHHTVTVTLFVLAVTVGINALLFFVGEDKLSLLFGSVPAVSHLVAAIVGLVPNCATSVLLSTLCAEGLISAGIMMSGLFSGAGVGFLVLIKVNKHPAENALIAALLVIFGTVFGLLGELFIFV